MLVLVEPAIVVLVGSDEARTGLVTDAVSATLGALTDALDVPAVPVDPDVGILAMPFEDAAGSTVVVEPVAGSLDGL